MTGKEGEFTETGRKLGEGLSLACWVWEYHNMQGLQEPLRLGGLEQGLSWRH